MGVSENRGASMGVSENRGPTFIPQCAIILMTGPPKQPPTLGSIGGFRGLESRGLGSRGFKV